MNKAATLIFLLFFHFSYAQIDLRSPTSGGIIIGPSGIEGSHSGGFSVASANMALGNQALKNISTGTNNIAFGTYALHVNNIGSRNIAIGHQALRFNSLGGNNIAIGDSTLNYNTIGASNIAVGAYSLIKNNLGSFNIALGPNAMRSNVSGNENIAIGSSALSELNNSSNIIGIGQNAANRLVTAVGSLFIGRNVFSDGINSTVSNYNTIFGNEAGAGQNFNTIMGFRAGESSTGDHNVAIGSYALRNADEDFNIAIGGNALRETNSGHHNTAIGYEALGKNTVGYNNIGVGYFSLFNNRNTNHNIGIGNSALFSINTVSGTGSFDLNNTAIGDSSLFNLAPATGLEGNNNIAIGYKAGFSSQTGHENIFVGNQSGQGNLHGSGNVFIGHDSGLGVDASDMLVIENSADNRKLILGDFANNKVGIAISKTALDSRTENLVVNGEAYKSLGTGNWLVSSDLRLKTNIKTLNSETELQNVLKLNGVSFEWKDKEKGKGTLYGFIAQDLKKVYPNLIHEDKNGYLSAEYGAMDAYLVEAIKALKKEIDQVKSEINNLKK